MAWSQFVVSVGSPSNTPGNEAQCTFTYGSSGAGVEEGLAMLSAAFIAGCGQLEGGSYIAGVTYRANSMAGALDVPWNASAWSAIRGVASYVPDLSGYGDDFGTAGPIFKGGSMLLLERTSLPGRSFTGRKYIPCISAAAVNATGTFDSSTGATVASRYNQLVRDYALSAFSTVPVVRSKTLNSEHTILTASVSLLPARLRSRQR